MIGQALFTLPREAKGPIAPPPVLGGSIQGVADVVAGWPEIEATTHWHLNNQTRIDGINFYVGADELGHIHLDGSVHLATTPDQGAEMAAEGLGRPFLWRSDGRTPALTALASTSRWRCSGATTTGCDRRRRCLDRRHQAHRQDRASRAPPPC